MEKLNTCESLDFVTPVILNFLADIKYFQQDFKNAYLLYAQVYHIRKSCQDGHHHADTAMALFHAGKSLYCCGKVNSAHRYLDLFRHTISSSQNQELLTENSVKALQSVGWMFHQQREFSHAKVFYESSLLVATRVCGKTHKTTARILNQLGNLNFELGHSEVALKCYKEGLLIESTLSSCSSGYKDFDIFTTLSNIASCHEVTGHFDKAVQCFFQMIELLNSNKCEMGSKQKIQKLAVMLSKIAALYTTMGLPDCAIKALMNALCIVRQEHGNNNMNVAVILNDLGIIYGSQVNTQSSLLCFEESLRIRQCLRSDTIVPVLFNIARCHAQKGDHKGALRQYEKIVVFEMQKRWDEHGSSKWSPNVVLHALDHMATSLHSELREPRKALYCYEKGLQLMKEMDSAKIPLRFQSKFLGNAGSIQLELGNGDEALRLFSETMRVNIAAGYEFNSNINTSGLDLLLLIEKLPRGAPAA